MLRHLAYVPDLFVIEWGSMVELLVPAYVTVIPLPAELPEALCMQTHVPVEN
jgi:hypothetical protein